MHGLFQQTIRRTCPFLGIVLLPLMAGACSGVPATSTPAQQAVSVPGTTLQVVATSNIVADWVRRVAGEGAAVFSLLPAGADPHTFQPGAQDITRVARADSIFTIGLGLEGAWLDKLVQNAAADPARILDLGDYIDPLQVESDEENDDHGPLDPHFWFDPVRVKVAATAIADRLSILDPTDAQRYQTNAALYGGELDDLHAWTHQQVSTLPVERRVLVTSHDSFRYFAERYGFQVLGTVLLGVTTEREPTAAEMAALVDLLRQYEVPAVFTETTVADRVARRIADEAGITVVHPLYTGSLGAPGGDADTYIGMMRANVKAIVEALQ